MDSAAKALITTKPFLEKARQAARQAGLKDDAVFLMGAEKDATGTTKHWRDITAKGAWLTPSRPHIDPKKDLAYLVYSSVSGPPLEIRELKLQETMLMTGVRGYREPQDCQRALC